MRLVLDANEYIYSLGLGRIPACVELLSFLSERREHDVRVIRTIVDEVIHNTLEDVHSVFYGYLRTSTGPHISISHRRNGAKRLSFFQL
mgnify:CR=1 FL=1